jgi:hypothetical protein
VRRVVLYHARDCYLCGRALAAIEEVRGEVDFELELVAIDGDPDLERRYRELLPVVEIDGERAFTYAVSPTELRVRLA